MMRFLSVLLLVILAFFLQFLIAGAFGVWINFAFGVLVAASFFLPLIRLLPLILIFLFIINWREPLSAEFLAFAVFPVASFAAKDMFRWHRFITFSVFFLTSMSAAYLVFAPNIILSEPGIFMSDVVFAFVFGAFGFKIIGAFGNDR